MHTANKTDLLPFFSAIMETHIPGQLAPLTFNMYDESSDPDDHLKMFINRMAFHTINDVIWCKVFSLSLQGEALKWFNSLPQNFVENFNNIYTLFG